MNENVSWYFSCSTVMFKVTKPLFFYIVIILSFSLSRLYPLTYWCFQNLDVSFFLLARHLLSFQVVTPFYGWHIQNLAFNPIFLYHNDFFLYLSSVHTWHNPKIIPPLKSVFQISQISPHTLPYIVYLPKRYCSNSSSNSSIFQKHSLSFLSVISYLQSPTFFI